MSDTPLSELRARASDGPPYPEGFLRCLADDSRAGAKALHASCLRRVARSEKEVARLAVMWAFEEQAQHAGFRCVAGVDEAGRGPLAGPVVAGAVVLRHPMAGLDDSKRLTHEQREALFAQLHEEDHAIGIGCVSPREIDAHGIQSANYGAMVRAVQALPHIPDFLLVDGFAIAGTPIPQKRIIKGDQRSLSIAAASIIAKVTRDRMLEAMDSEFPGYGFARHKGYGTQEHLEALERLGPCPAHRRSFAPLATQHTTGELF